MPAGHGPAAWSDRIAVLLFAAVTAVSTPSAAAGHATVTPPERGVTLAQDNPRDSLRQRLRDRFATPRDEDGLDDGAEDATAVPLPAGIRVTRDIAYGPDPAQRLDVYGPEHAAAPRAPILVMVHGGGWKRGDKRSPGVVAAKVAHWGPKGYLFVSVNYRLLPGAGPLDQADDVARALAAVQGRAASFGGDPDRVVLMGHSAGAHLVTLLAADSTIAARQGARPWLGTVALDSAAFDVERIMRVRHLPLYDAAFGDDPDYWRKNSPAAHLGGPIRPLLAVCSANRMLACPQARAFAERARGLGGPVTVQPEPLSHRDINATLGQPGPYTQSVEAWLRAFGLP